MKRPNKKPRTAESETVSNARRLLHFLGRRKKDLSPLLILTHDFPDPDALAAAFALEHLAESFFGVQARITYGGIVGRTENRGMISLLKIPAHRFKKSDLKKYAHVALVDTQPGFGNNPFPKNRKAALVIDQHPSSQKPAADLILVDADCGATCVIVARALLLLGMEIPVRVATALAYGILSDTMSFYRSHRADLIQTYLDLLPFCDMRVLAQIQNPPRTRRFFQTLAQGIRNAMTRRKLLVSHLGFVENPDLVAQIADFLLNYRSAQWALTTGRYRGRLHASFRMAKPGASAGEILRDAFPSRRHAGGHDVIAGGSMKVGETAAEERWAERELELVDKLMKRLKISRRGDFRFPFRPPATPAAKAEIGGNVA